MVKQQSGFTLIELIMVIVVLGALAVSVIPRYVDLQTEADIAAVEGVAGALAASSATNYAACVAGDAACLNSGTATVINNCTNITEALAGGSAAFPGVDYTITAGAFGAIGTSIQCTITGPAPTSAATTFTAISPG